MLGATMINLLATLFYLAVGALISMIFVPFSWSDPWTYIIMILWPLIIVIIIFLFTSALIVVAAILELLTSKM